MNIEAIIRRAPPRPWADGDNIPWNEPGFSERMLQHHLSQDHDAASRRFGTIDRHVAFIHAQILAGRPARVLDLGCGPGFYALRLCRLGHCVRGIDFSPASIAYARRENEAQGAGCVFELEDIRTAEYGSEAPGPDAVGGYDLVMLLYGEFNVFSPPYARLILRKAWNALKPGGLLLLEPSDAASIRRLGAQPPGWEANAGGLFSERPHLLLRESAWDADTHTAVTRYYVIEDGETRCSATSYQMYENSDYRAVLHACGFGDVTFYPSLLGEGAPQEFIAITARKPDPGASSNRLGAA